MRTHTHSHIQPHTHTHAHTNTAHTHARMHTHTRIPRPASPEAQHQVERALLLDVVVGQRAAVLQLLAGKDQALLVGGDA